MPEPMLTPEPPKELSPKVDDLWSPSQNFPVEEEEEASGANPFARGPPSRPVTPRDLRPASRAVPRTPQVPQSLQLADATPQPAQNLPPADDSTEPLDASRAGAHLAAYALLGRPVTPRTSRPDSRATPRSRTPLALQNMPLAGGASQTSQNLPAGDDMTKPTDTSRAGLKVYVRPNTPIAVRRQRLAANPWMQPPLALGTGICRKNEFLRHTGLDNVPQLQHRESRSESRQSYSRQAITPAGDMTCRETAFLRQKDRLSQYVDVVLRHNPIITGR